MIYLMSLGWKHESTTVEQGPSQALDAEEKRRKKKAQERKAKWMEKEEIARNRHLDVHHLNYTCSKHRTLVFVTMLPSLP